MTTRFEPLPAGESLRLCWPTPNHTLFTAPEKFFARTRVNPDFGRPGMTRDCGKGFHRGCDIAPVSPTPTGRTTTVMFSDCAKNIEYPSEEPTFTCDDKIYAVFGGRVVEVCVQESASLLGRHIVIEHIWPVSTRTFFTLYGHLETVCISAGDIICAGQCIGRMGQTSSSAYARTWMAIAPHLHFEAWNGNRAPFDPELFLCSFLGCL